MICQTCGTSFTPKHPRGRYCSGRCRVAAWEKRKRLEVSAALDEVELAVQKVRAVVVRGEIGNEGL